VNYQISTSPEVSGEGEMTHFKMDIREGGRWRDAPLSALPTTKNLILSFRLEKRNEVEFWKGEIYKFGTLQFTNRLL